MTLTVKGLRYARNRTVLFDRLTFEVSPGEILHIIGANGAGKTSLLGILTGLVLPAHGCILWHGVSILQSLSFKKDLLYLSHKLDMRSVLTPFENLYLFWLRRGCGPVEQSWNQMKQRAKDEVMAALLALDLASYSETITALLSVGQQRRLLLAKLLLAPANCWILDEPFTALDRQAVALLSALMNKQAQRGGVVIFTSHQSCFLEKIMMKKLFLDRSCVE